MANPVPQFVPVLLPSVVFVFAPDEVVGQCQTCVKASHDVAFASIQFHDMFTAKCLIQNGAFARKEVESVARRI